MEHVEHGQGPPSIPPDNRRANAQAVLKSCANACHTVMHQLNHATTPKWGRFTDNFAEKKVDAGKANEITPARVREAVKLGAGLLTIAVLPTVAIPVLGMILAARGLYKLFHKDTTKEQPTVQPKPENIKREEEHGNFPDQEMETFTHGDAFGVRPKPPARQPESIPITPLTPEQQKELKGPSIREQMMENYDPNRSFTSPVKSKESEAVSAIENAHSLLEKYEIPSEKDPSMLRKKLAEVDQVIKEKLEIIANAKKGEIPLEDYHAATRLGNELTKDQRRIQKILGNLPPEPEVNVVQDAKVEHAEPKNDPKEQVFGLLEKYGQEAPELFKGYEQYQLLKSSGELIDFLDREEKKLTNINYKDSDIYNKKFNGLKESNKDLTNSQIHNSIDRENLIKELEADRQKARDLKSELLKNP